MSETEVIELENLWKQAVDFVDKHYPDLKPMERRITILSTINQLIEIMRIQFERTKLQFR